MSVRVVLTFTFFSFKPVWNFYFERPPLPLLPQTLPQRTPVVVMAMEFAPASAPGAVAMEMLPVLEEDESGFRATEDRRGGAVRRRRGPRFDRRSYYLLVVIGQIGTEPQLEAARRHIERGECGTDARERRWRHWGHGADLM